MKLNSMAISLFLNFQKKTGIKKKGIKINFNTKKLNYESQFFFF